MAGVKIGSANYKVYSIDAFDSGLTDNPLRANECGVLTNLILCRDGALRSRGYLYPIVKFASTTTDTNFHKLLDNRAENSTYDFIHINADGAKGYTSGTGAATSIYALGTVDQTLRTACRGLSASGYFVTFFSNVRAAGSAKVGVYQWDGVTLTTLTNAPDASSLIYNEGVLFAHGRETLTTQRGNRIFYSNANDPSTWPAVNWTDSITGNLGEIVDLFIFRKQVFVIFQRGIGTVIGSPGNYILIEESSINDVLLKNTFAKIFETAYVAGTRGVYGIEKTVRGVSESVKSQYRPITYTKPADTPGSDVGVAALSGQGNFYAVAVNTAPAGQSDLLLYNIATKSWSLLRLPLDTVYAFASTTLNKKKATVAPGGGSGGGGGSGEGVVNQKIYIADTSNDRIVRIDDILGTNWVTYGASGSGVGQFDLPIDIHFDSANRIYLTDTNNNRIVRIDDMLGTNWVTYGTFGSGVGQFRSPVDIHVDTAGRIYVIDNLTHRIVRIDDMLGTNWVTYGTSGGGVGQFIFPSDLYIDSANRIYITDYSNDRIVRIDDMLGTNWVTYGTSGGGVGQWRGAESIALDSANRIYVADDQNSRIVRIDDMLGTNWVTYGTSGGGVGQFWYPEGIKIF